MLQGKRWATPVYALIQGLYWATYCLMVGFASVFLLDRGFTNGQIGLILGLSYLFSAILQPTVGAFLSRRGIRLNRGIACMYAPVVVIALAVRLLPLSRAPLAVMITAVFTLQSMLQPSVNALSQSMSREGDSVNFGVARGVGSAAYALTSFAVGRLLTRFAPGLLPVLYGSTVALMIVVLLTLKTDSASNVRSAVDARQSSYADMLREHRHMAPFLAGVGCMFLAYSFIDCFLLQIITSKGGNSANLGTAITLSAMTELPAMLIFSHFSRKGKGLTLFMGSMWFWLLKDVLTLLAPTPQALYGVQLLNFAACAIYVPGMMDYMRLTLPSWQLLRGVTLAGTATTLGSLVATIVGGAMIDAIGMTGALTLVQLFAAAGAVLVTRALVKARREIAQRAAE